MNVRPRWGVFAAVGAAFLVGLAVPAGAHAVRQLIDGSSIKQNSVTGKQIAESTLGHVPYANKAGTAAKLRPLVWHNLRLTHGWSVLLNDRKPAYTVDAQGIVHLRGAMCCSTGNPAFTLPTSARPAQNVNLLVYSNGPYAAQLTVLPSGQVDVFASPGQPSSTTALTSLEGVTFASH